MFYLVSATLTEFSFILFPSPLPSIHNQLLIIYRYRKPSKIERSM